jgi:hypothetical protein
MKLFSCTAIVVSTRTMVDNPQKRRFVEEDPEQLRLSKYSKKTEYSTNYAQRLFQEFLEQRQKPLMELTEHSLNDELCSFYAFLRKEDGENMSSASITNIRYALARFLKTHRNVDIIKDPVYTRSNEVFLGKLAKLKREGKGAVTHYAVISNDDLLKVASIPVNTPSTLQMKVWFTLQFHFAQRGSENIHDMKKSDLHFHETADGRVGIRLRDFLTKNHRATDTTKSTEAILMEVGGENCPVQLVKRYLSLLVPNNAFLWQKPNCHLSNTSSKWYHDVKVGQNTIAKMMSRISTEFHLSEPYTNHCVRATAITLLGLEFGDVDICSISGHKSLNALGIYKRTGKKILESMSAHLHNNFHGIQHEQSALPSTSSNLHALPLNQAPCSSTTAAAEKQILIHVIPPEQVATSSTTMLHDIVNVDVPDCSLLDQPPMELTQYSLAGLTQEVNITFEPPYLDKMKRPELPTADKLARKPPPSINQSAVYNNCSIVFNITINK